MAQNNGCITYRLPDGDRTVISWEYFMEQITPVVSSITQLLNSENTDLARIQAKLEEWADDSDNT